MGTSLRIRLEQPGGPRRLEEARLTLRSDLLELDVEDVLVRVRGDPPPGTRAIELADPNTLLVVLQGSADLARKVLEVLRGWIHAEPERTVEVSVGDTRITLTGASPEQQDRLIEEFAAAVQEGVAGT